MDREISQQIIRSEKRKKILIIGSVVLALLLGIYGFRTILKPSVKRDIFKTAVAGTGPVEATIAATGVVIPEYELELTTPTQTKIDTVLFNAGDSIHAGQSIVKLNKEFMLMTYDNLKDEQGVNQNKVTKTKWTLEKNLQDLKTQYKIKQLNIESLESSLKSERQLKDIGGSTQENVSRAELNLKTAQLELQKLQNEIDNLKRSMVTDMKDLDYEINIQGKKINDMQRKIEQAEIKSPRNGVVTWVNDKIGAVINEGEAIARVADLSTFRIDASISDTYADKLVTSGEVIVRINDTEKIKGKIANIKPKVENGVVNFTVTLNEKRNRLLRPSLKVDVFLVVAYKDNVVRVKNGSAFNEKGEQDIFVVRDNRAVKRKIVTGASNADYVEVMQGIRPGEEVIISDLPEYNHLKDFSIK